MNKKLDTTGLAGKDRILMLAEIIKAHEAGRFAQSIPIPRTQGDTWYTIPRPKFTNERVEYRIMPVSRTVYVNLYGRPDEAGVFPGSDENFWTEYPTAEEARKGAIGGAFAVAVPITIEE